MASRIRRGLLPAALGMIGGIGILTMLMPSGRGSWVVVHSEPFIDNFTDNSTGQQPGRASMPSNPLFFAMVSP